MKTISNLNSHFTFQADDIKKGCITGYDDNDKFNGTTCFNITSRRSKKAWEALFTAWDIETTMWKALDILEKNGVKMHSYCSVD